jgi:hypothetical protein
MPKKFSKREWKKRERTSRMWQMRKQVRPQTILNTQLEEQNRNLLREMEEKLAATEDTYRES